MKSPIKSVLPIATLLISGAAGTLLAQCDEYFAAGQTQSMGVVSYGSCSATCLYSQCGTNYAWAQGCSDGSAWRCACC